MRAVALSDVEIQNQIREHLIPLQIEMEPGATELPLEWPGLERWAKSYQRLGGEESKGFTCCVVISPDLAIEYGGTGSAMVWELFDSIAYDPEKFLAMLEESLVRAEREEELISDPSLSAVQKKRRLRMLRRQTKREVSAEGRFNLPPRGFTVEKAKELFQMTGDLPE